MASDVDEMLEGECILIWVTKMTNSSSDTVRGYGKGGKVVDQGWKHSHTLVWFVTHFGKGILILEI
jgi:hemolysin activation/secretion protein